jgi:hypothetical protein
MTSKHDSEPLTFKDLDGLALAAAKGRLAAYGDRRFHVDALGPWLELRALHRPDISAFVIDDDKHAAFDRAVCGAQSTRGLRPVAASYLVRASGARLNLDLMASLQLEAYKHIDTTGMGKDALRRVVMTFVEMFDNLYLHSEAVPTGVGVFQARPGSFEFAVSDAGVGVLASLRRAYPALTTESEALTEAIKPNITRFTGEEAKAHGHGFDQIIEGMANANSVIRLRSGDAALQIDGVNGRSESPQVTIRPPIKGFCISAKFHRL